MSGHRLFNWNEESIRWYINAEKYDIFHKEVAKAVLAPLNENPSVCDAGSGIGALTFLLAPSCRRVTALDVARRPLEIVERLAAERGVKNIDILNGDFRELPPPEEKFDAVVFCMFGRIWDFFESTLKWSRKKVFFIQNTTPYHSFSAIGKKTKTVGIHEGMEFLDKIGARYSVRKQILPMGQPFESRADAERFMEFYDADSTPAQRAAFLDARLTPNTDPAFPLFLPSEKHFMLFEIDV